eukprot:TRINITY_DN67909_c5_g4_i1.p1 TRINITY_DN67909_c5_g4~~TRINITY_DN67909_c5_g4_i1.p1  ORF type:complete len:310 (-),score=38.40 TRINITY_DN67909_c5_g4_i1:108-899(-)
MEKNDSNISGDLTTEQMLEGSYNPYAARLIQVPRTDEAWDIVEEMFHDSIPKVGAIPGIAGIEIINIERVKSPLVAERYALLKHQYERKNEYQGSNEMWLWHGTAGVCLQPIIQQGFNRSYAGRHAALYGQGVYFAVDSCFSAAPNYAPADDIGNRRMFLTRVLVGNYTRGRAGLKVPPENENATIPFSLYDSVVDSMEKPTIYVAFSDAQALPQFVVTYKGKLDYISNSPQHPVNSATALVAWKAAPKAKPKPKPKPKAKKK